MASCDALVIGGGPAGATAACLLARAGWDVVSVEQAEFPRRKVCGEFLSATNLPLLDQIGIAAWFAAAAGPPVRQVGVFAGGRCVVSGGGDGDGGTGGDGWGRAIARERLDEMLLEAARSAGAQVYQPVRVVRIERAAHSFVCELQRSPHETIAVRARHVIAAHGSWGATPITGLDLEAGRVFKPATRDADLLAFKARFAQVELTDGLMPLLAFRGGYGGLVHSDGGHVTLSCCLRRDRLAEARRKFPRPSAAESVLEYIKSTSSVVAGAFRAASVEHDSWRSAGPIRPGVRATSGGGIFRIGNAAGEAHPVIAEGIGMAMQGAALIARRLVEYPEASHRDLAAGYHADWHTCFARRLRIAGWIASWAMNQTAVSATIPILRALPGVITEGARQTGKLLRTA